MKIQKQMAAWIGLWLVIGMANALFADQTNDVVLTVRGEVDQPLKLTREAFQNLPHITVKAKDKDGSEFYFEGVSLAEILKRAKPKLTEKCCGNVANTCVIVSAADNYRVVFSLAEIQPEFTDRIAIVADRRDGSSIPKPQGPLRLVVPGEKVHARWVRQVTALEVVRVNSESKP